MKKIIFGIIFALYLFNPPSTLANTAGNSARLTRIESGAYSAARIKKIMILRDFLNSYDSPLAGSAHVFVEQAEKNNIDWKLVVSIAGVESYFGQLIPQASYNAWGYGVYGPNVRYFTSWDDGISTVSSAIRNDYINTWKATNIYEIGNIYAADPLWASKVEHFMEKINYFEKRTASKSISISI